MAARMNVPAGWMPDSKMEDVKRWQGILIHHSAADFGDVDSFDTAHKQRGWDGCGYHFVISNGNNSNGKKPGTVEVVSRWKVQKHGAHCRPSGCVDNYWNEHTIGICLVGNFENGKPCVAQMKSLVKLVKFLKQRYSIPSSKIMGHNEVPGASTKCPGKCFSLGELKRLL